ncbi:autotransporter outer membrane beta-barrel domain-containing protein [Pseudomonas sp. FP2196]|uniref:autotransporter outer membrane beta-barrel domain-containing protein n=1 Tax=Pseudomonas sp. FP2196 TaxID=2954086 RepID=UPI002733699F|nr:autotransporter outer membrane beta-barrel domain-containing protein [Pseudomonas sp. FP2196]WLH33206.1 autotransporter outer membrane beta-barrel domain-containing protein [Pseudomonas sp. FP2196]
MSTVSKQRIIRKWSPGLMLILFCSSGAQARILNPGENETLTPASPIESWIFGTGSTLTVNGAETLDISTSGGTLNVNSGQTREVEATEGTQVNLNDATVSGASGSITLSLINSSANISGSTISGLAIGMQAVREQGTQTGSVVNMQNSTVQGTTGGAFLTSFSVLNMSNSTVQGTGADSFGLSLSGGSANLGANSKVIGDLNGVIYGLDTSNEQLSQLVLDKSSIEGKTGAAIVVDLGLSPLGPLVIQVLNGSTLSGGNGSILEVAGGTSVDFNVENSQLNGNVIVERGSAVNVSLDKSASLTGDLQNVSILSLSNNSAFNGLFKGNAVDGSSVKVESSSTFTGNVENVTNFILNDSAWVLAGNNQVGNLEMAGGTLDFARGQTFYRLDVENLSGNGFLKMATDFGTQQTDFLNVTNRAEGNYELSVTATGSKPTSSEPIQLVKVATGEANFALSNGSVDAGAFTYKLFEEGDGWFLRPDTQISTSTRSVLAIANTAPTVIDAERTLLNTRMGDRRLTGGGGGVWTRTYGNRYSVQNGYGDGYSQTQQGLVIGVDTRLAESDWLVGAMMGYSKTDLDLKHGSTGTVDSYSVGGYLTKLDTQTGFYIDAVAKINSFDNKLNVSMSDGERSKGDYNTHGLSGSLEVGKQYDLTSNFFLAPFVQVNAAVISGKHYALDNGLEVDSQLTRSLVTKGGVYVGSQIDLGNGQKIQPRVRLAMGHEFIKSNAVNVNESRFNNDTSTTSMELAGGINWALPNGVQVFAEAGSSQSKTVTQEYNMSVGFSIAF